MSYISELESDLKQFELEVKKEVKLNDTSLETETLFFIDSKNRKLNGDNTTFQFEVIVDEENVPGISKLLNIKKIELVEVIIPNFYINLKEVLFLHNEQIITSNTSTTDSNPIRCERLSNLNYLFLSLDRYNNNRNLGTNNSFRNKSFVVKPQFNQLKTPNTYTNSGFYTINSNKYVEVGNINNNIIAETNMDYISLKSIEPISIEPEQSNNKILNFNISLNTNNDKPLSYLNDTLTIVSVTLPSSDPNKIKIEFNKFFSSEEYKLGDTILIKPGTLKFDSVLDLESFKLFLEREEGHTIVEHFGSSEGVALAGVSPVTNSKLFKAFYIPTKFTFSNSNSGSYNAANLFSIYEFGIPLDTTLTMLTTVKNNENKLINLRNQITIILKITC